MKELLELFNSPSWWLSVVFVGIAINLASAYLKPLIDRLATQSDRDFVAKLARERRAMLEQLARNPHEQVMRRLQGIELQIARMFSLSVAVIAFAAARWGVWDDPFRLLMYCTASWFLGTATVEGVRADRAFRAVRDARRLHVIESQTVSHNPQTASLEPPAPSATTTPISTVA